MSKYREGIIFIILTLILILFLASCSSKTPSKAKNPDPTPISVNIVSAKASFGTEGTGGGLGCLIWTARINTDLYVRAWVQEANGDIVFFETLAKNVVIKIIPDDDTPRIEYLGYTKKWIPVDGQRNPLETPISPIIYVPAKALGDNITLEIPD